MPRLILSALALGAVLAPAAIAQTTETPAPAPLITPAPEGLQQPEMTPRPDTATPAGRTGCGRDRNVMS